MNIEALVPKLSAITRKKRTKWRQVSEELFLTKIGEQEFQISRRENEESGLAFYRFDIYIGESRDPNTARFIESMVADQFQGAFSDLEELYTEARRNALGLDKVFSDIDAELDRLLS